MPSMMSSLGEIKTCYIFDIEIKDSNRFVEIIHKKCHLTQHLYLKGSS